MVITASIQWWLDCLTPMFLHQVFFWQHRLEWEMVQNGDYIKEGHFFLSRSKYCPQNPVSKYPVILLSLLRRINTHTVKNDGQHEA
jgi:hypothetical protein